MSNQPNHSNSKIDRRFRYEPMIPVTVCFAFGVFADRMLDFRGLLPILGGIFAWISWIVIRKTWPRRETLACCFLYITIFSSGALWHHSRWNWFPENEIGNFAADEFEASAIRGVLITEPVRVAAAAWNPTLDTMKPKERIRFQINVISVRSAGDWILASGTVRVSLFLSEQQSENRAPIKLPQCGDEVEVIGSLIGRRPTSNPGQFDFENHFRAKSQFATIFADSTDAVRRVQSSSSSTAGFRARVRASIDRQLHLRLAPDHAAFASAVLLGNRDQMDIAVRNRFLKTGASHLLAISGLHVGILASGFLLLLRLGLISRRNCLLLTIAFVVSYAWLVEFRPTVLRAAILICVMCGARLLGRTALSWGSLTTALMIVLIVNPSDLFSLGTQLSFLAISSIIIGKPWIFSAASQDPVDQLIARTRSDPVRWLRKIGREIRSAFCVSFLIWLMAIPLVAYHFHSIAIVAPLLNPLLLIPMALGLYFGMATIVCGATIPPIAFVPAAICGFSLGSIQWMIDVAAIHPAGHFWSSGPTGLAVAVFYLGVFLFAVIPSTKLPPRWCLLLGFGWLVFGWLVPDRIAEMNRTHAQQLEVTVIDVRHGSAALIKLPDGQNILCDCGSLSGSQNAARTISEVLWHERIDRLDAVIVSHADVDHFNALPELLDRFTIGSVWISPMMANDDAASVRTLRQALDQYSVPIRTVEGGNLISLATRSSSESSLTVEFLGPSNFAMSNLDAISDNALSVILCLRWNGRSILLPGDVEKIGLEALLGNPIEQVDFLVAAHHGSKNSDPKRFAAWCKPEFVVASCGAGRFGDFETQQFQQGHPCQVLSTNQFGAIRCVVDREGRLTVMTWTQGEWRQFNHL
ncbi:ComEC/Rec2 family competence protein [Mariniblastus fucicola]|uniref:ComEC family competence protein n=1 Tax=Mariniblastus fucicola TaxID=980251 RepID=A0A5B9PF93_9BACT|nr:ComEC/Rec2 family competence protein [Mariniblastus fucicola]QEG23850.1 ComEC family competence protein [Mariniblastus fucicola]